MWNNPDILKREVERLKEELIEREAQLEDETETDTLWVMGRIRRIEDSIEEKVAQIKNNGYADSN